MAHLESPTLASDLTVAREFDLGMTGPPLSISMDFIAGGMVEMIGGIASAVILAYYAWWAPLVLAGAWIGTHLLLRENGFWRDRNTAEVRSAQRDADYAYRLAEDPPARQGTTLVSHRFSSVRMADLIVVLDGARLVEIGTHDQLRYEHHGTIFDKVILVRQAPIAERLRSK